MAEKCEMTNERRHECDLEFGRLWSALSKGDEKFGKLSETDHNHELSIKELQTNMIHLVKSMSGLTTAIWGAVLAIALVGIGFIVWFIQTQ